MTQMFSKFFTQRLLVSALILSLITVFFSSQAYSQENTILDSSSAKKILVLGDSLSAAYKLPLEKGWVYLLQERLKRKSFEIDVINASVSGATSAAGIQILDQALTKHKPDIILLELGANDGLQGKPVAYITKNLDRLIRTSKSSGAHVMLIGIKLPPNYGSRYTAPFHQQYHDLAQKHQVSFVPFLLEGIAGKVALMMEDGLHPRAEAQPMVLDNIWPSLLPLIKAHKSS